MIKAAALLGAVAAATAPAAPGAALAPGPPDDPGVTGIPHCTVPTVRGMQLAAARRKVASARCAVTAVTSGHSSVKKGRVALVVPRAGTVLAEGTGVVLIVSSGLQGRPIRR